MNKPWYGVPKDLHQEVICKYGSHHNIWVGSSKLIEWPEGFDCMGICMDVDCPVCTETGDPSDDNCICDGIGKVTREKYAQYILDKEAKNE